METINPKSNKFELDRLSGLPDSMFHHILSFIDIKDLARISTLSRRCRNVCLSSPFLTIILQNTGGDHDAFCRFNQFLHRFMSLRNGAGMCKFKVDMFRQSSDDYDHVFQIGNWVLEAIRCNVEKIYLRLNGIGMFTLPSGVLNCASLRDLELNLEPQGLLRLPPATSFVGLEELTLRGMSVSIKLFGEWISSCKSLKLLFLDNFLDMHLNISSSSLETLILTDMMLSSDHYHSINIKISAERLRNLRIEWLRFSPQRYSLKLHAPKLEKFLWDGDVSHYSYEGNFDSLSHADIYLHPCPSADNEHGALATEIIDKVLQTVYRVSSVCISDDVIKVISLHELLPEFCNLRSLLLIRTHIRDDIPSRVSLLNSMPHLNTLKIWYRDFEDEEEEKEVEVEVEEICYNSEYWESQNLEFVHSLKEVEIDIKGEENEIELIKYLLKNAKSLKKMTILYPSVLRRQSVISRTIQQFQIASPSIALYFLQR